MTPVDNPRFIHIGDLRHDNWARVLIMWTNIDCSDFSTSYPQDEHFWGFRQAFENPDRIPFVLDIFAFAAILPRPIEQNAAIRATGGRILILDSHRL